MDTQNDQNVSLGNWMLTLFLTFIPIVNIIMLIVWAVSAGTPPSKQNWARAALLWMAIFFVLFLVMSIIGGIGLATLQ
ncbi:hypothetical protein IC757_08390 [Wenzhouxiangella sp. AB-CW3]|uniref:hypothetical protein n=1 Tax=Wenzhouxiangella sp. AB-CW3 TaxID=2771012 RepID=UPI00168AE9D5|nr:hypothetical protein [Wenzhouxiangella sp. AB-CW3]QOC24103.1 hypothetical protein IC757_08390 [Wenzhouxiangella sp. AB-CW3]